MSTKQLISEKDIEKAMNEAYKDLGHNAYFGNGFKAGVRFAIEKSKAPEMLEMLKILVEQNDLGNQIGQFDLARQLIKEATEL